MSGHNRRKPVVIWAALMLLTIASVIVAEFASSHLLLLLVVFGVAIIKGQLVAVHFMEVDLAATVWQTLYRMWIIAIGLLLIGGHILSG